MAARKTRPTGRRADGTHWLGDKTHCVRGHRLEGDNVRHRASHKPDHPNGGRACRKCSNERARLASRVNYWQRKLKLHEGPGHVFTCADCDSLWAKVSYHQRKLDEWRALTPGNGPL